MKQFSALYAVATLLFLALDTLWLTKIAGGFYKEKLSSLLADKPLLGPAALFYAVYIFSLIIFVIKPGLSQSLGAVAWKGALLGFTMYATYDLTNQTTLKNWPASVTAVDLLWGSFITATVSVATVCIYTKITG